MCNDPKKIFCYFPNNVFELRSFYRCSLLLISHHFYDCPLLNLTSENTGNGGGKGEKTSRNPSRSPSLASKLNSKQFGQWYNSWSLLLFEMSLSTTHIQRQHTLSQPLDHLCKNLQRIRWTFRSPCWSVDHYGDNQSQIMDITRCWEKEGRRRTASLLLTSSFSTSSVTPDYSSSSSPSSPPTFKITTPTTVVSNQSEKLPPSSILSLSASQPQQDAQRSRERGGGGRWQWKATQDIHSTHFLIKPPLRVSLGFSERVKRLKERSNFSKPLKIHDKKL